MPLQITIFRIPTPAKCRRPGSNCSRGLADIVACLLPASTRESLYKCHNQVVAGPLPNNSAASIESRCCGTTRNQRRHPMRGTGGHAA